MRRYITAIILMAVGFIGFAYTAHAVTFVQGASLSSSAFRVLDSQHAGFKASSSSDSYQLLSTIGDIAIGSSSGTTYGLRSGFLYYPLVIAPGLTSATPGNGKVDLVWTAAEMDAGWTVGGYNACFKKTSQPDSAYNCATYQVGAGVLLKTITGLTSGTSYTFKVQAREALSNVIAESGTLSATPTGGGGGGGGGGGYIQKGVDIEGYAHAGSTVTILRDGVLVSTTTADSDGTFDYRNTSLSSGTYMFGFWAEDVDGLRSVVLSIPVTVGNSIQNVRNVIIASTIQFTGPNEISSGTPIGIAGRATPNSQVRIRLMPSGQEYVVAAAGDGDGRYSYNVPTGGLADGVYTVSARTELLPGIGTSNFSQLLPIGIGVPVPPGPVAGTCDHPPDINSDSRINLIDFSVLAFWWRRLPLPTNLPFDLNCDNQVRLDDFSILAYHWSG